MGKRGENIRKRKDGRWEARIITGYSIDGKAKYHSLYGHSYAEVKEKRNLLLGNPFEVFTLSNTNSTNRQKILFEQILKEWLISRKELVKESSWIHYRNTINNHIMPELGQYFISDLTQETLETFLKNKLKHGRLDNKGGLSSKTVSDIRRILLSCLDYARSKQYPCVTTDKIFHPRVKLPDIQVLSREDQDKLETNVYVNTTPVALGILLSLYCGLRIGEVCALQWKDIHFDTKTLRVDKTMLRIQNDTVNHSTKTRILIDRPKTENSNRTIPIPSCVLNLLSQYKQDDCFYILTGTSKYMEPRSYLIKYKKFLAHSGVTAFTYHALRHTFATRCVENGFDPKSLSEILGHSNVSITLQRYVHPSMETKRQQMEKLAQISILNKNR